MLGFLKGIRGGAEMPAPSINRRSLLLGLAAASTAAAGTGAAYAMASAENSELLRLGEETPTFAAAYHRAVRAFRVRCRWGEAHWPKLPATLECTSDDAYVRSWVTPLEDFHGRRLRRSYWSSHALAWRANRATRALRSKAKVKPWHAFLTRDEWQAELAEVGALLPVALAFEADMANVSARADAIGTYGGISDALKAFSAHIAAIMAEPEAGMAGLLVKAEALAAWGTVEPGDRVLGEMRHNWHSDIAAAILRQASLSSPA